MWKTLTSDLEREVAYCSTKSELYHDVFSELRDWTKAIGRGESDALHVSEFKGILEVRWKGRQFQSWFERPLLLSATLHRMVQAGGAPRLARFYATMGGKYDRARDHGALREALADVLTSSSDDFAETLAKQPLQTNEVSRGVTWLVPYVALNTRLERPCILVELGCSSGLNLIADHYSWDFAIEEAPAPKPTKEPVLQQAMSSTFNAELRRRLDRMGEASKRIEQRIGCDLTVPDLGTAADLAALSACIWGDDPGRLARLRAAADQLARARSSLSIDLLQKDMFDLVENELRGRLEAAPPSLVLIYNTVVTCYISADQYQRLQSAIGTLFRSFPKHVCAWIEHEPVREGEQPKAPKAEAYVRLHRARGTSLETEYLGITEMHPKNLTWLESLERLAVGPDAP